MDEGRWAPKTMKPNNKTPANEGNRTVLMVDGHGNIRTIRKFRQKLWIAIGTVAVSLLIAAASGWLYVDGLQTQQALEARVDALQTQLTEVEQQKDLLLARAVKAESRTAPVSPAMTSAPALPSATAADKDAVKPTAKAAPEMRAAKDKPPPPSSPAPEAAPPPEIRVGVEKLKVDYDRAAKALSARFVIRNNGNTQAEGRAVVVLSSSEGEGVPRLSLPPVPLKNDRPRGNRGRRFSISRFMRLSLKRKVAEPGLRFDTADIFVFDMKGNLLQEKTFEVAVTIPAAETPPPAPAPPVQPATAPPTATAPPSQPAAPAPAADQTSNSILAIPSKSEQEPQGGQED